ncbi:MAG: transglycosylase SLT domain-containing protein [Desulfobacterales bacterium]|jgi:LysM repeat protein|nr:transglycosylase SLT domain-containing protein [Desulfobacterales bacterium]
MRSFLKTLLLCPTALLAVTGAVFAQPPPRGAVLDFTPLIEAARVPGPLDFCGEPVPLAHPEVRERMEREMLLVLWDAPMVILWAKRAGQHLEAIESALKAHKLPLDLKYVPIAESNLRPHAGSPKGAMGFWQFMGPTAQKYGLQVDSEKDQRRNLADSTAAAIAYLKELHGMFGSWTLAAAAYNMGENGLRREIAAQDVRDYYRLYLPLETQRYVFRILAAKLILSDPGRYGFHLTPEELYRPAAVDIATVEVAAETPVLALARAAGTDFKTIKDLNPEIRGYRLAPGRHQLRLPANSAKNFQARLAEEVQRIKGDEETIVYVVKEGDSLGAIAERFRVPLSEINRRNQLDPKKPIHPGQRLSIAIKRGEEPPP